MPEFVSNLPSNALMFPLGMLVGLYWALMYFGKAEFKPVFAFLAGTYWIIMIHMARGN